MLQIRGEQVARMRRKKVGDTLIERLAPFVGASWDGPEEHLLLEDASGPRGRLHFDGLGFLGGYTSPLGRSWQLKNDPDGKLLELASPSGHLLSLLYTPEGLLGAYGTTTQARIDLAYQQRHYVASYYVDGTSEQVAYDSAGDPQVFQSRLGEQVRCTYDGYRRLTSLTDGNGHVSRFTYDRWNRPEVVLQPNGQRDTFRYTDDGLLAGATQGDTAQAEVTNDPLGRPLAVRYNDGTEAAFSYNDAQQIASAASSTGEHTFTYDERGQFAAEIAGPYRHAFTYDAAGRLASIISLGAETRFRWDADSRLVGITDWSGGEHLLEYLPGDRGHVHTGPATHGDPGVRSFVRTDTAGRLMDLQVIARGDTRFALHCAFDVEGRLQESTDSAFGQHLYSYDADSRVVFAEAPSHHEAFSYDRASNLAAINATRLIYDGANQLLTAGNTSLRWDDRGNLLGWHSPDQAVALHYNARNQLVASVAQDGTKTVYAYDALGRRISKRTGEEETRFFWAGEHLTCQIRADLRTGTLERQDFLYHPETGVPLLTAIDGEVFHVHTDHLGTPRALTSATGELVWLAEYTAFGEARLTVNRVRMPLRLRGQYHDPETGLHYNRFRYYAPQWGRYISRDPLTFAAGTNHYLYAGANPLNETDATGLINWKSVGALAVGAGLGVIVGVALAPFLGPAAVIVGGAVAGAVAGGLNEYLNDDHFCLKCIAKAAGLGALAGAVGALPFLALPIVGTGLAAFVGLGALGGALSYGVNCLDGAEKNPSWAGLGTAMALGGVFGAVGKGVGELAPSRPAGEPTSDTAAAGDLGDGDAQVVGEPANDNVAPPDEEVAGPGEPANDNTAPPGKAANDNFVTRTESPAPDNIASPEGAANDNVSVASPEAEGGASTPDSVPWSDTVTWESAPREMTAEDANAEMAANGEHPCWKPGTKVYEGNITQGNKFNMAYTAQQAAVNDQGGSWVGNFATPDNVPNQAFAENNLAIKVPEWKSDVSSVGTVETTGTQLIRAGQIGPVDNLEGGARQVQFGDAKFPYLQGTKNIQPVGLSTSLPPN